MKLYLLVSDGGDGSYSIQYILDETVLNKIEALADEGVWNYESGFGCDGDGFHYSTINVPDNSTAEYLGIPLFTQEDLDEWLEDFT